MAFEGGKIPVLGLSGQQLVQQLTTSTIQNYSRGYESTAALAAGGANVLLNVGLSAALGQQAAGQLGFNLNSGTTFLASQVQPFLSSTVSNLVNNEISSSLNSLSFLGTSVGAIAGQAASNAATSLVNGIFGTNIGGGFGSAVTGGVAQGATRSFPGAGNEPKATYGGSVYNMGQGGPDVVFTIRPASSMTPQTSGILQLASGFQMPTTLPTDSQITSAYKTNLSADLLKNVDMRGFTATNFTA